MWPFTKLEKRIDQLQSELSEMRLRIKDLEYKLFEDYLKEIIEPGTNKKLKSFDDYLKGRLSKDEIKKIKQDAKKEAEDLDAITCTTAADCSKL